MYKVKCSLIALVALALTCVPVVGKAKTRALAIPARQVAAMSPHPLMWVIRDKDSTLYLFGSIHAMREDADWLTPAIRQRFDASGEVWLEIANIGDTAQIHQVARKYMLNPANDMTAGLSEDEVHDLDRRLAAYGMSSQGMMGWHKWAIGLILMQRQLVDMGLEPDNGIDVTFDRRAKAMSMSVKGFETMDQQMQVLSPRNDAEDIESLRMTLKEMDETPEIIDSLITGWLNGDEATLRHYLVDKLKADDPDGYQRYLVGRNAAWVPQIERILAGKGTVFIAVGTAHLVGPDSLIAMLKKDGIKAKAVKTGH